MIKLSASSIGTFDKCPKQYHYRYIEKPDVPAQDWTHLEFGKLAHRVLELFHEELLNKVVTPEEYPAIMSRSFKSGLCEFNAEYLLDELPDLKEILTVYLNKMIKEGIPQVISNEMSFDTELGNHKIRGYIDRIDLVEPGHYKVVDYKTNKNPKYLTNFQLLLYAIVIRKEFPDAKKISGEYVLLKQNCETIGWDFTDKQIDETTAKILKVGDSIETRDTWEKRPTKLCNWCDFKTICQDAWAE